MALASTCAAGEPVPLHPTRLRERGYNQIAGFGKALAHGLSVSYNDSILKRAKYTKTQTKKNLEARAENAAAQSHKDEQRIRRMVAEGALPTVEGEGAELEARTRTHDLDSARFGVRAAQHEVAMAEAMLRRAQGSGHEEELEIRSPLAGRVLRVVLWMIPLSPSRQRDHGWCQGWGSNPRRAGYDSAALPD